jgi:hypothetical protein
MEHPDPFQMEPEALQGAFADILERALRDTQRLPRPALAWMLARDLVAHMSRCRYQIALDPRRGRSAGGRSLGGSAS